LDDDAERTLRACTTFVTAYPQGNVRAVVSRLNEDPDWSPIFQRTAESASRILHNLPLPEFDDTGLVGRFREARELARRLHERREPVLTVVGEGGIGKTALAVKVLYDLVDDPSCPYEAVLWVSLKTEQLTGEGIRALNDVVLDLVGITDELARTLGDGATASLEELGGILEGVDALVVIDNLETANAEEILTLYDSMPASVRFLFTSRVGLGQLERRIRLNPLSTTDSSKLFRALSRHRDLGHLARLPEDQVDQMVTELGNNPLAIRWFVLAIEAGAQPQVLLKDQRDLLEFLVRSVYDRLAYDARNVLITLFALERPLSFAELAVLTRLDIDQLRGALLDLQRSSMLEVEADRSGGIGQVYTLTTTTHRFVRTVAAPSSTAIEEVLAADAGLRSSEERRRFDEARRRLGPNSVVIRSDQDKPVAHILRLALLSLKRGNPERARGQVRQAEDLAPDYFEVYRVAAFIESTLGHVETATTLYEKAMELAPMEQRPRVAYYYSGHLTRAAKNPSAALPYATLAEEQLPGSDAALVLGQILMYLGRFREAEIKFEEAVAAGGKVSLIATTNLVELGRRECESMLDDAKQPSSALKAVLPGIRRGTKALSEGTLDRRLVERVVEALSEALRAVNQLADVAESEEEVVEILQTAPHVRQRWPSARAWSYWERSFERMMQRPSLPDRVRAAAVPRTEEPSEERGGSLGGVIRRYLPEGNYGFLVSDAGAELFFHKRFLKEKSHEVFLVPGTRVAFRLGHNEKGPCAVSLAVLAPSTDVRFKRRGGPVIRKVNNFGFIQDERTGVHIFFHRGSMRSGESWDRVEEGSRLEYEVEVAERGPAVRRRTAELI
jgi:cold shock CspA family protein/tetratricopeptide (TPR) repeat protein